MKYVVLTLALFGAVLSGGGHHGGPGGRGGPGRGPPPPPFLRNVTSEARQEYFDIMRNRNETIAQQKQDVNTWATKYGVTDQVDEFNANMTQQRDEMKQNMTTLISSLPAAQTQLEAILDNENQTPEERDMAMESFRNENREAFETLHFMGKLFRPRHGPRDGGRGGPRGMGGRDSSEEMGGRRGGMGGGRGGMGGRQGGMGGGNFGGRMNDGQNGPQNMNMFGQQNGQQQFVPQQGGQFDY